MISKILALKNVGLFRDGCPPIAVEFKRSTLIYAENGRGKSTFAAVLRACQLADNDRVNARKTIDVPNDPEITLLVDRRRQVRYAGGMWHGTLTDVVIFDSEFVEENVYSGFSVRPDQRQKLLSFALGEATVQLTNRLDDLAQESQRELSKLNESEKYLTGLAQPLTLDAFLRLEQVTDAEGKITTLQGQLEASRNAQALTSRKDPVGLSKVQLDLDDVFLLLAKELEDVVSASEAAVTAHFGRHYKEGIENWVQKGQVYLETENCPFCGQPVTGSDLLIAYRTYFNASYRSFKAQIADLRQRVNTAIGDGVVDHILSDVDVNRARIEAWKDHLDVEAPTFDDSSIRQALASTRAQLLALVDQKINAPLEPVGTSADRDAISQLLELANRIVDEYNTAISQITDQITVFKATLFTERPESLKRQIDELEATIRRYEPSAEQAHQVYQATTIRRKELEREIKQTRRDLEQRMSSTLVQYRDAINGLLRAFGASFSLNDLAAGYKGRTSAARTEYSLNVRGHEVSVNDGADFSKAQSLSTTLSEADKRTLALAFFVARLEADPDLGSKIVVLDDPVSSMDRNRRHETTRRITDLGKRCKQLIVLSHDGYFLRDLRDGFKRLGDNDLIPNVWNIVRVQNDYSAFGRCDLDVLCESDYYRHHRMVVRYVESATSENIRDVAKALRPLLEGYYHRRFPGMIPRNQMFGKIISEQIEGATSGPLLGLTTLVPELRDINEYASQFHHDTNPGADSVLINDAELTTYARRTLDVIYRNG